jgi:hypothetical protein
VESGTRGAKIAELNIFSIAVDPATKLGTGTPLMENTLSPDENGTEITVNSKPCEIWRVIQIIFLPVG